MTDVGVAGELVKDGQNGFIFPVGDSRACAEALKKLIARDTALYPAELLKKDELLPGLKKSLESLGG
jgi:glycosyltransferase involved in cell wall biosynthesis